MHKSANNGFFYATALQAMAGAHHTEIKSTFGGKVWVSRNVCPLVGCVLCVETFVPELNIFTRVKVVQSTRPKKVGMF